MTRLCACGCGPLPGDMRSDAIWRSRACAVRWARENPGRSLYDAHRANKGRTKPAGRKASYCRALGKLRTRFGGVPEVMLLSPTEALAHAEDALRESLPGEAPTIFIEVSVGAIHASNKRTDAQRSERKAT